MATSRTKKASDTGNKTKKARKKPERMGPDFLATLFVHIETVAIARQVLDEARFELEAAKNRGEVEPEKEDALSLRVVGAARRLDVKIQDARAILKGTNYSGLMIEGYKTRLAESEQASRIGWALVEDRF